MDFDQCPCSGRTLARLLQPAAMVVLAAEPLHGYRVAERLRSLAMFQGRRPDPTGLYRLLKSMEEDGLVVAAWDLADRGPARRRYPSRRKAGPAWCDGNRRSRLTTRPSASCWLA